MNYSNFSFKQILTKICLLLFFSCNVFAQQNSGKIKGVITTSDGELAAGVNIILKNSKYGTITNEDGAFEFNRVKPNTYTLQVSLTGYETLEKQINVTANETTSLNLKLTVSNKQLKEVIITTNRGKAFPKQSTYVSKLPLKNIENPQVYNIVSSELMKEQAITNYEDALKNVPGIQKLWESTGRGGDGGSYYSLRGFEVQANIVNGLPGLTSGTLDPANIERIEVIKGPSGTLFGSSLVSYGGLINTVTKKPYEGFGGEVSYLVGSFGLNRATADINTPLDDNKNILFRINSSFQTENSFQDAGFRTSYFIAPTISYKVNERLSFLLNTEFMQEEKTTPSMLFLGRDAPLQYANLAELNYNTNLSFYSDDLSIKNPRFNLQAHMNYKISSKWNSQTVFSRGTSKSNGYYSYIYDNEDGNKDFGFWITKEKSQTATTDIQQNFTGDFKIGPMRNRIVIGFDYFKRDVTFGGTGYAKLYNLTAQGEVRQFDDLNPNYLTVESVDQALLAEPGPDYHSKDATYSAYASDVLNITPTLLAMASLRVDYFDTEGNVKTNDDNYNQTALSPKFGLVYQPIKDQLSVFANYMNGFRNIAPSAIYDNDGNFIRSQTFEPEHANQLETGIKTDLFSDKLTATASFYIINVANLVTSNPMYSAQGGEARSKGFEFDLNAAPIKGLSIIAGYSYNDSKITKGDENNVWLDQGQRPFWAGPKNLVNLWATYKFDEGLLENFGLGFGGNYASDNAILDSSVTGKFVLPEYTVINGSVFYNSNKFRVSFNINNIANKDYFNGGWSTINPQKPRNVVASLAYKF
ncbi:iron complex outermembrane recepter protein [Flavobacterium sp. CF108]|uniref:TonB-dependent receptor n=1 Tax=unclassified Flavobacterium TaxID=196869 RepID=UPI0008B5CCAA|nr:MULTISPECIES: TonB-dependent receptor [unclassified Flavobacterium]SEO78621.1 iron complex outermembrane recepter protein [Flavobacterium sp. fv08]SHG77017.1 iron complex outermembrane recepter protein [Flavobacterium sp. CF108]